MSNSNELTMVDGKVYKVMHWFGDNRALIDYDGLYVFVDQLMGGWDLSGEPARDGVEKDTLKALLDPTNDVTRVVITKS